MQLLPHPQRQERTIPSSLVFGHGGENKFGTLEEVGDKLISRIVTWEPVPGKKEEKHQTGANTPVGVKVRRLQEKINQGNRSHTIAQQIQPILRSFIDLRGGLKGSQRRTGTNVPSESS